MRRMTLGRLGYLALLGTLAVACASTREPVTPREPAPLVAPAPAPAERAALADREAARLSAPNELSRLQPVPGLLGWVQSLRPTPLRAGPGEDALQFTLLPDGSYLKALEARDGWLLVVYGGDGQGRQPGGAWVRGEHVALPNLPPRWAKNHRATTLWAGPEVQGLGQTNLPLWSWLELTGQQRQGRLLVRYPGDGRYRPPGEAWVDAEDIAPVQPPEKEDLPRAYPATLQPAVLRLRVPYRSQLDGSAWAEANCGPTTLAMGLEALGVFLPSSEVRQEVLDAQQVWGDDAGVYLEALGAVPQAHGARTLDLASEQGLRRWSLDDVRRHLRAGGPVILQVRYRALPGREDSTYYGDHYIVVTGLIEEGFLYNDSVDSDGVGFDRVMTPAELARAMEASDRRYARTGFALAPALR